MPHLGHIWDKLSSACKWSGDFSWDFPIFATPSDLLEVKQFWKDRKIKIFFFYIFQLYSWGGGACLGCGSPEAVSFKPRLVEDLQSTHIVDIACGDSHCLALTHGKIIKLF